MKNLKFYLNQILDNEYYTNYGPLSKKMDMYLEKKTGFKNVISVSNYVIAIMMVMELFQNKKNFYFDNQTCPEVLKNFKSKKFKILKQITSSSINFCFLDKKKISKKDILISNAPIKSDKRIRNNIAICNLEYFKKKNYIFTGSIIFTNNDYLAEKLRNIRSSYGSNKIINVYRTINGRFSELQSALYLSKI